MILRKDKNAENELVEAMVREYEIVETTTERQFKNGTRQFLTAHGSFATYRSGYVRRCDSSDRIYQLNPQYKGLVKWVWTNNGVVKTTSSMCTQRALIHNGFDRIVYLLEYLKRNYNLNKRKTYEQFFK
jgi:hypothetical protein